MRTSMKKSWLFAALGGLVGATALLGGAGRANAQPMGALANAPPNVLLLVDTSGSMERMGDGTMPVCNPGVMSDPNRWGMLLQATTGSMQPYYSCYKVDRSTQAFKDEYKIAGKDPYDANYVLPYHRPLTGDGNTPGPFDPDKVCGVGPYKLVGMSGANGVTKYNRNEAGNAEDWTGNGIATFTLKDLQNISTSDPAGNANKCVFDQANDGQLDFARDYLRFGLMTFDSDPDNYAAPAVPVPGSICGISSPGACGPAYPSSVTLDTANPFLGLWSYVPSSGVTTATLPACSPINYGVGARAHFAPPWEGRHVKFPKWDGTTADIQANNDIIQQVLLGTRPYGATPIAGQIRAAIDYLLVNPAGPRGVDPMLSGAGAANQCREQYVIILTDGAPNLDLRPTCTGPGGTCPFATIDQANGLLDSLYKGDASGFGGVSGNKNVKTFVIGFSVNGTTAANDGFPTTGPAPFDGTPANAPNRSCLKWYQDSSVGGNNTVAGMRTACTSARAEWSGSKPPSGSTAEACCTLTEMAYAGSGGYQGATVTQPFFAESQADLAQAFATILGSISKGVTTRTVPTYGPPTQNGTTAQSAIFNASFDPQLTGVWAGDIRRYRTTCNVGTGARTFAPYDATQGDSFAQNMANTSKSRFTLTVSPPDVGGTKFEGRLTLRPYAKDPSDWDDVKAWRSDELAVATDTTIIGSGAGKLDPDALGIDNGSCKKTATMPKLNATECARVAWGFATSTSESLSFGSGPNSPYQFNKRCFGGTCNALGGIYHATPTVVGPPSSFSRDEAYREYAAQYKTRPQVLYTASIDGLLHAFDAQTLAGGTPTRNELFAFIPPGIFPDLLGNFPGGQRMLLDGRPVTRDVVFERSNADISAGSSAWFKWHTVLVAGIGNGGGYYALDITDPVADNSGTTNWQNPNESYAAYGGAANAGLNQFEQAKATRKKGPHFLWQIKELDEKATTINGKGKKKGKYKHGLVTDALFGDISGTPAVTSVFIRNRNLGAGVAPKETGIAILPGGMEASGAVPNKNCKRAIGASFACGAGTCDYTNSSLFKDLSSGLGAPYTRRDYVRQWDAAGCDKAVASRSVTIVRIDTGEIVAVFGRQDQDLPAVLNDNVSATGMTVINDTPLDSPMNGIPVVYPNEVGQPAKEFYMSDADGTIWRFDISDPNPKNWTGSLFFDTQGKDLTGRTVAQEQADTSQPISVPMILSLDDSGNPVLNVGTGDQESIVDITASATKPWMQNRVLSITAVPTYLSNPKVKPKVNWHWGFAQGERVTGPMDVFDGVHYFATMRPPPGALACGTGEARLYGWHYTQARGGVAANGGAYRYPDAVTAFEVPFSSGPAAGQIIPGVSVLATQACFQASATPDPFFGGNVYGVNFNGNSTEYSLFVQVAQKSAGGGTMTYGGGSRFGSSNGVIKPKTRTRLDSWATVVD